jgi:large subunit ribosomal protein L2
MNLNYVFLRIKKQLRYGFCDNAGRNCRGVITVHHRGGGNKNCHLYIDFIRRINSFGYVVKIKKLTSFTGFVGLVLFLNGLVAYSLIGDKFRLNQQLYQGSILDTNNLEESKDFGCSVPCSYLSLFSSISNVEVKPFQGGLLARAAGTSVTISRKKSLLVTLKLKSG